MRLLPDGMRDGLREPLGVLVPDEQADSVTVSAHIVGASYVVTVGDRTTEKVIGFGIVPNLQIVDGRERRAPRVHPDLPPGTVRMGCANPPAAITDESVARIREAFSSRDPVRLAVEGEEDLLVIPACVHAPANSVVMYGQPGRGVVVVHVDGAVRRKTQTMLDSMDRGNDETVAV